MAVSDEGALLLGECKWVRNPAGPAVLDALMARRDAVVADFPGRAKDVRFAVCSRAGFTPAKRRRATRDGVLLFDLDDLAG